MGTTVEYEQEYATIVTPAGRAAIAAALAGKETLPAKMVAFGDGEGEEYLALPDQTALKREVYRCEANCIMVDPANSSQLYVQAIIPADVGGFDVREAALITEDGTAIAIASMGNITKPVLAKGMGLSTAYEMYFAVNSTEVFELKIDPAAVMATKSYVNGSIAQHNEDPEAHGGTIRQQVDQILNLYTGTLTAADGPVAQVVQEVITNNEAVREQFNTLLETHTETLLAEGGAVAAAIAGAVDGHAEDPGAHGGKVTLESLGAAANRHGHTADEVDGLADAIAAGGVDLAVFEALASKSEVNALEAALQSKAETSALNSKADKTYVDAELGKKANSSHGHGISEVTGLTDAQGESTKSSVHPLILPLYFAYRSTIAPTFT